MHFQIFIPGVHGGDPKALDKVGLGDLNDGRAQLVPCDHGPDHQGGVCIAWPVAGERRMGYQSATQTWIPSFAADGQDAGAYWVGFWNDSPPGPEELLRLPKHRLRGEQVELADGREWIIPSYRSLPQTVVGTSDGTWTVEVKREYLELFELGVTWGERIRNPGGIEFTDLAGVAVLLLRLNYRVTPEVASHLGIFDTATILRPLLTFIGAPHDTFQVTAAEAAE